MKNKRYIPNTTYMKGLVLIMLLACASVSVAQTPVLKVDLNYAERNEDEVHEPGYTSWLLKGARTKTYEGVTFSFINGGSASSWYKGGVQAPNYARLVSDGIKTDDVELQITGLKAGTHTLVTFHNTLDNPETTTFSPLDIFLNGTLVYDDLELTNRVTSNDKASTAFFKFNTSANDTVTLRFKCDQKDSDASDKIMICGFHLNSSDPKKMASLEYPSDRDEHVNIDNDTLNMSWVPPLGAESFDLYFGKSFNEVVTADKNSAQYLGNITDANYTKSNFYSMDSYYWRVDPVDSNGEVTKGDTWYFKKRINAFPGAEGYGGYAIGGRGGKVVYVTNLEDSGVGSFRDAVENHEGPRTILFAVSGIITLHSRLVIRDDYITVAGQSAPGKGVCFRWAPIGVTGDNLIVQNIRVRLGIGITFDGMGLTGSQYSIIDHCSISWTIDESFSSRGAKNITLQRTLISEALNAADHANYGDGAQHGYAASIGGDVGSFHHNLLAHCNGRNWSLAGGLDGDLYYAGKLDLFNNVVYNWGSRATDGGAHEVNFVGNYYKKGKATSQSTILKAQLEGLGKGSQSYFYHNNIVENTDGSFQCNGTNDDCSRTYKLYDGQNLDWDVFVDEPFFESHATIHNASDAYKIVMSDVGNTQPAIDDHDIRVIDETLNGTTSLKGSRTGKSGFPDHEKDAGYWEVYPGYERNENWDSDLDGLPNWWEETMGLNSNSAANDFSDSNDDSDKNGYTNLEEYLQWMSGPHYFFENGDSIKIDLSKYTKGFTNKPSFSVSDFVNGTAFLQVSGTLVSFTPDSEGLSEFKFTVADAEGTSMTQKIGLYVGELPADSMFTYSYILDREETKLVTVDSVNTITTIEKPDGIADNNSLDFQIYPNPANETLNIQFKSSEYSDNSWLYVYDIVGKPVISKQISVNSGNNTKQLILISLKSGIYFIQLSSENNSTTKRFIKN